VTVAVANIDNTEVAERIRPDRTKVANSDECLRPDRTKVAKSDECLYRCPFPHQLDRQAIQHLLRLTVAHSDRLENVLRYAIIIKSILMLCKKDVAGKSQHRTTAS
jgi:hypothetical protein